jgi:hypothetical protein
VVTIGLDDLLAKAGLAETADGTQLTSELPLSPYAFSAEGMDLPDQHRRVTGMDTTRRIDRDQRPQVNARIWRVHAQHQLEGLERRRRSSLAA